MRLGVEKAPVDLSVDLLRPVGMRAIVRVFVGSLLYWIARIPGMSLPFARLALSIGRIGLFSKVEHLVGERDTPPRTFRDRVATLLLDYNPRGTSALLAKVEAGEVENGQLLEELARRYYEIDDKETPVLLRRRAVELEPNNAAWRLGLGLALGRLPVTGVVHDSILGLTDQEVGDLDGAISEISTARALAPHSAFVAHSLGKALIRDGRPHDAIPHFETATELEPRADWLWDLGNAYGRPQVLRFDEAARAFKAALALEPENRRAYASYVNAVCRGDLNWSELWKVATEFETSNHGSEVFRELRRELAVLFDVERPKEAPNVVALIEQAQDAGVALDLATLRLIALRLFFLNELRQGYELKRFIAWREVRLFTSRRLDVSRVRRLAQALVYSGRTDDAISLLEPPVISTSTPREAQQVEKLAADAHLIAGRIQPFVDYSVKARKLRPLPGDDAMRALVEGKRVAIVGPAETTDELGETIDQFDTVIRPRFVSEFVESRSKFGGSRTDITYYSGRDLAEFIAEARDTAHHTDLQLVVARPLGYAAFKHRTEPWLRFYRQDFSLYFQGAALGVARIAYDVLQFAPAEICVFNSDFYTGAAAFASGYRAAEETKTGTGSVLNDIFVAHDLRFEFQYAQALMRAGVLTAQGVSARVLEMDVEQYIHAVEQSGTFN